MSEFLRGVGCRSVAFAYRTIAIVSNTHRKQWAAPCRPEIAGAVMSDPRRKLATTTTGKAVAMCWQCDHPEAAKEDYFNELRQIICTHGWAVQCVEDARRPFDVRCGVGRARRPRAAVGVGGQSRRVAVAGRLGSRPQAATGPRRTECRRVAQNA